MRPKRILGLLEQAEERLFALRAVARKHAVPVADLPALLDTLCARLAALETGAAEVVALEQAVRAARAMRMRRLPRHWGKRGARPQRGWIGRSRRNCRHCGSTRRGSGPRSWRWRKRIGARTGRTAVRFLIATNPGQEPGPLGRIASGGELSRLMLALKVVLSAGSPAPTLVFDEVDADVGGATAAAVGERLARVAERVQVLVVTHSPQVAARGGAHMRVSKQACAGQGCDAGRAVGCAGAARGDCADAGGRDGDRGRSGGGRRSAGSGSVIRLAADAADVGNIGNIGNGYSPSPCGRGLGGGGNGCAPAPSPQPPPARGGGGRN